MTEEARDCSQPPSSLPSPAQSSPIRREAQVKHDEEPLTANPLSFHRVTALIKCISGLQHLSPTHHMFKDVGFCILISTTNSVQYQHLRVYMHV